MQLGKIWTNFYLNIHPSCKSNCHKFLRSPSRMQRAPESMTRLLTFRCMCTHCHALHVCRQATTHVAGCDSPNLNAPHCTPSLPLYLFIPASSEVCSFGSCILCIKYFLQIRLMKLENELAQQQIKNMVLRQVFLKQ